MLSQVYSLGIRGAEGYPVLVELDMALGLPAFATVGLPDSAVREARERVVSAVRNSGYKFPPRKVTVNLAPAQSRKQGTQFDLAIALAVLSASGQVAGGEWGRRYGFIGELALDGGLRPVPGALAMALRARREGFAGLVVAAEDAPEASCAGLPVYGARSLREVAELVSGTAARAVWQTSRSAPPALPSAAPDLRDVKGQPVAKRALEIAAAGGHHLLFIGPPGSGKSMLARRLPGLLPPMSPEEAVEVAQVHSAAGSRQAFGERPFRAPHHSASHAALVGGGPAGRPGEASLAHGGVLFLDELGEFCRPALESLRQPLEEARLVVARARETYSYPARFQLVAATNPCPCGWRGHGGRECLCTPPAAVRYLSRLSGPLLDRVDIQLAVLAVPFADWAGSGAEEPSSLVRERVAAARRVQAERFDGRPFAVNAGMSPEELRRVCPLDAPMREALEKACAKFSLSARSLDRALRVARTIADLEGGAAVSARHVKEALGLRHFDRLAAEASPS